MIFADADKIGPNSRGDVQYHTQVDGQDEWLTLFNRAQFGIGTKYVAGGLWEQKRQVGGDDYSIFDLFVYGFPTVSSAVPRRGFASYGIDLFGVASPLGVAPHNIIGEGLFSIDFNQDLFGMEGQAREYNTDVGYSTCCHIWEGAGKIGSSGLLSGYFVYNGRDQQHYQAAITGDFYGPHAEDIGGTLLGGTVDGGVFTGVFAGTHSGDTIVDPLSALSTGDRTYVTYVGTTVASQRAGQNSSEAGAYYFPKTYGLAHFGADGNFLLPTGINDPRYHDVTFTKADIVGSESNSRFTVYRVVNENGAYRLSLLKPGASSGGVKLTYSGFGSWQETRAIGDLTRQQLTSWFFYGVPTVAGSLPRSGAAHYDAAVLGSGERYTDATALTLTGTAQFDLDFATLKLAGVFDADAKTSGGQLIDLPQLTFGGDLQSNYAFQYYLIDPTHRADGEIQGRLYGPGGEEIGGTFDFFMRNSPGSIAVDGGYAGVFYGKRN